MTKDLDQHIKLYKEGEVFFFEGEVGDKMFIIQAGSVVILKKIQNLQREIAVLESGDFFGEMSILLNEPRSATAKAREETTVVEISSETFSQMLKENVNISVQMVEALAERIRDTDDRLKKIMEDRIFIALISYIEDSALSGQKIDDGKYILGETIEDLARVIGLPIIKIDEVLKKLAKYGFIEMEQNRVILKDWKTFKEFKKTYITKYKF
jgi:CRP-like cAMP-binding protein